MSSTALISDLNEQQDVPMIPLLSDETKNTEQNDNIADNLTDDMFRSENERIEIGSEIDIFRVSHINLVSEEFNAAFYIEFQWAATKKEYLSYKQDPLNYVPSYIPSFMFGNGECEQNELQIQKNNKGYRIVKCGDRGSWNIKMKKNIRYPVLNICLYKFVGTFTERFELKNFPFDVQDLQLNLELDDNTDIAIFVPTHKMFCGHAGFLSLQYSALQEYTVHNTLVEYGVMEYEPDEPPFGVLTVRMKIERNYGVYFWKIVVFAFVTTASTLFAFSMDPIDTLPDRYGFVVTLLLTAVAFQFVVSTELPKLPYLTLLDEYIVLSFCYLFIVMVGIGIVPFIGDRYNYDASDKDDVIHIADNCALIISITILMLYHIYFAVKIIVKRKTEVLKVTFDKWEAEKHGFDVNDSNILDISIKEHCRIENIVWDKYIDPKKYSDCIQRRY